MSQEIKQNTNLASEFFVISCLYRIGANAYMTLGNKKSVDIIVEYQGKIITIDVKGLQGTSNWPIDNWDKKDKNHYLVFVSYNNKISNPQVLPDVFIKNYIS